MTVRSRSAPASQYRGHGAGDRIVKLGTAESNAAVVAPGYEDLAIGTYRRGISKVIPEMTKVALLIKPAESFIL